MKKELRIITLYIMVIACVFLLTGCNNKKEEKEESTKPVFEIEQVNDKNIKVNLDNAIKDDEKTAKLKIDAGEEITTKQNLKDVAEVTIYYYKVGTKLDKNNADSEILSGKGESTTSDFPAGEYEILVEITNGGATGDIEVIVK